MNRNLTLVAFFALIILLTPANSIFVHAEKTSTLTAIEDAHVWAPDRNYGNWEALIVETNPKGSSAYTYIKFDLSTLPKNAVITSATLNLRTSASRYIDATTISVHFCSDSSWNEQKITMDNRPAFDSQQLDSTTILEQSIKSPSSAISPKWYYWSVTPTCREQLNNDNMVTFVLVGESKDSDYPPFFDSKESSNSPRLTITYDEPLTSTSENQQHLDFTGYPTTTQIVIATMATIILALALLVFYLKRNKTKQYK